MDEYQKRQAAERGYGEVAEVLHTATVLHEGWEMDNKAWVVRMDDGSIRGFTTSHGGIYPMTVEELQEFIEETQESLGSLLRARDLLCPLLDQFEAVVTPTMPCPHWFVPEPDLDNHEYILFESGRAKRVGRTFGDEHATVPSGVEDILRGTQYPTKLL